MNLFRYVPAYRAKDNCIPLLMVSFASQYKIYVLVHGQCKTMVSSSSLVAYSYFMRVSYTMCMIKPEVSKINGQLPSAIIISSVTCNISKQACNYYWYSCLIKLFDCRFKYRNMQNSSDHGWYLMHSTKRINQHNQGYWLVTDYIKSKRHN